MNVAILDLQPNSGDRIKREFQGGFGLRTHFGDSLPARLLLKIAGGSCTPFIYLGYIAALAKHAGHAVSYALNVPPPDANLIVIHASMVAHTQEMAAARACVQNGQSVYFVGPFASAMPELFIENGISVVVGEPEAAFRGLFAPGGLQTGIIQSPDIQDLDELPFPLWEIFPYSTYTLQPKIRGRPVFPMLLSRSCPYRCNYCPYLVMSDRYRRRSVANAIAELQHLSRDVGMKGVFFRDATFTASEAYTLEFCEAVRQSGLRFEFMCETRLDCLSKPLLRELQSIGLRGINVGVETPDFDILSKNKRKPIPDQQVRSVIRAAERMGIKINAFYIVGYPEDTREKILNTIAYAKGLNTFSALFYVYTPLPGTYGFEQQKERLSEDWEQFDGFTPTYRHDKLSAKELNALLQKAYVEYYWRPRYILKHIRQRFIRSRPTALKKIRGDP
jgi:radical SAM superfamily enzyme YgiQ (UPF0313 family)